MSEGFAGGTYKMGHLIVVRATWDHEASVWTAESSDLPGLVTEASSLDELDRKLPGLIQDLMEDDDDGEMEIPVEVVASFSKRVRVRARAA
jgi:predicted RNase H-like HicB family nuclease